MEDRAKRPRVRDASTPDGDTVENCRLGSVPLHNIPVKLHLPGLSFACALFTV